MPPNSLGTCFEAPETGVEVKTVTNSPIIVTNFPKIRTKCLTKIPQDSDSLAYKILKRIFYAEQMDAEGLGRKLLLTPPGDPRRTLKADCGYCDSISQNTNSASTFEVSQCRGTAKRGCLSRGEAFESPPAVCPPERPPSICSA